MLGRLAESSNSLPTSGRRMRPAYGGGRVPPYADDGRLNILLLVVNSAERQSPWNGHRGGAIVCKPDYLKTFLSGTPKLGALGVQVSIDLKTMSPPRQWPVLK